MLATAEEPPPISIPGGVKFFDLTDNTKVSGEHGLEPLSVQPTQGSAEFGRAPA